MGIQLVNSRPLLRNGRPAVIIPGKPEVPIDPPVGDSALTLNEFAQQRVYQRVGTSKSVTVSGGYTGAAPASIEARVVDAASGVARSTWATLSGAVIAGGAFSGALTVPQGGWYKIQVRDAAVPGGVASGANKWGVGVVIGLIGQSNMANFPTTPNRYPLGDPRAIEYKIGAFRRVGNINDAFPTNTLFGAGGYSTFTSMGSRADGYTYLANLMSQTLDMPVCLVELGAGGSNIESWQAGQSNWNNFASAVAAAGGDIEMAIWYQGESNARALNASDYRAKIANVHAQCRALGGRNDNTFKFGVVSLGPGSFGGSLPGEFGALRVLQQEYAAQTAGAFLAGCNYDAATVDGVHINGDGFGRIGRRYAKNALFALGIGGSGAGPRITGATRSGTVVTVSIAQSGGTALTDGNGGTGGALTAFRVFDAGSQITISSTAINGNTVVLTLAAAPTGPVTLDHAIANVPSGSGTGPITFDPAGTVYDNATYYASTIGCPLQPLASINVTGS